MSGYGSYSAHLALTGSSALESSYYYFFGRFLPSVVSVLRNSVLDAGLPKLILHVSTSERLKFLFILLAQALLLKIFTISVNLM